MTRKDNTEEALCAAKHYRKERDFVLYDAENRGFVGDGGAAVGFFEATRLTAVEANRMMASRFNESGRFPVKMRICDYRGIKPTIA